MRSLTSTASILQPEELPELPLNLFEPRYVELARRIGAAPGGAAGSGTGSGQFGYTAVVQRRKGGRGRRWSGEGQA